MEGELLEKRVLKLEYSPPGVMAQIGGISFEERVSKFIIFLIIISETQ